MKNEKISPQEQQRNEAYNEYVKQVTPTHNLWTNVLKAFLLGGFICSRSAAARGSLRRNNRY